MINQSNLHHLRAVDIRPARAADCAAIGSFLQRLSDRSKRYRFHGAVSGESPALQKLLCDVDGLHHQAWLAWDTSSGDAVVVGEARFVAASASGSAELAIAVADDWHGSGLADTMLRRLMTAASIAGISQLYGDVMDCNSRMRAFMCRNRFEARRLPSTDIVRMSRWLPGNSASAQPATRA